MDYTAQLKKNLVDTIPDEREKRLAFLCAVTKNNAVIEVYRKSIALTYEFEEKFEALAIIGVIKEFSSDEIYFTQKGVNGEKSYKIQLKDQAANALLEKTRLSRYEQDAFIPDDGVDYVKTVARDKQLFYAYLKGVLFAASRLKFADEEYSNYSLQLCFSDERYRDAIGEIMLSLNVELKSYANKSGFFLQSRTGSDISDVLAMCGASDCVLVLNNILAERENENEFNRASNFYMANYKKTMAGAKKYINAIENLQSRGILQRQDEKLKSVALARRQYEEDSMTELARRLGMSKTSLARRLNKILQLSEEADNGRE